MRPVTFKIFTVEQSLSLKMFDKRKGPPITKVIGTILTFPDIEQRIEAPAGSLASFNSYWDTLGILRNVVNE
jgi:hypothetical protein